MFHAVPLILSGCRLWTPTNPETANLQAACESACGPDQRAALRRCDDGDAPNCGATAGELMASPHRRVAQAAIEYLDVTCREGHQEDCQRLVGGVESLQFQDLGEVPAHTLMRLQKSRCAQGEIMMCRYVGVFCAIGAEWIPPDHSCAQEYLTISCDAGDTRSCELLADRSQWMPEP